jgi:hypothetical protein
MNCPSAYRHNIHRDTLHSITHTIKTRCNVGIRTHIGKIKVHNHSLGNDLEDTLANQAADGHPPDTTYTTGSDVFIGQWTLPYTLIPQTLGEPIPYMYTNLKTDAHTHSTKHTHTPLSQTSKHGALLTRAAEDGANFTFHKKHTTLTNTQFTHKQEFMWGVGAKRRAALVAKCLGERKSVETTQLLEKIETERRSQNATTCIYVESS